MVWLVHDWFRLNPEMRQVYGLQAISDLLWYGDDKIAEFLDMWKKITTNNTVDLTEAQKANILVEKMDKSKVLVHDVSYWRRLPYGNEQKTHEYLLNAMLQYLDRVHMDKNVEAQRRTIQQPGGGRPAMQVAGGVSAAGTGKGPCYFHNFGGCKNSAEACKFDHVIVSAAEKAKMTRPERRDRSRSPSPTGGASAAGGGQRGHCFKFLKGTCTAGDGCVFAHTDQAELDRQAKAKAKAKAKAEPKAKAKAEAKAKAKAEAGKVFRPFVGLMPPRANVSGVASAPLPASPRLHLRPVASIPIPTRFE